MKLQAVLPVIFLFGQITGALAAVDTAAITLAGRVLASTCTIDSSSAVQTVELPDISVRDLTGFHGRTEIPFILKDCGADVTAVKVTASGTADEVDSGAFANGISGDEGGATGVAISLRMLDGSYPFHPSGHQSQAIKLTPLSDNRFSFSALYMATTSSVTPGKVSTVVNFTFDYQ